MHKTHAYSIAWILSGGANLLAVKARAALMIVAKIVPSTIVFAAHSRVRNPLQAADGNDLYALIKQLRNLDRQVLLHRVRPISIKQKPSRRDADKLGNHRMQDFSSPWRIRDDRVKAIGR